MTKYHCYKDWWTLAMYNGVNLEKSRQQHTAKREQNLRRRSNLKRTTTLLEVGGSNKR